MTTTTRRSLRLAGTAALLVLFAVELVIAWPSLTSAFTHLRTPHPGWLAAALAAELAAMAAYARMQRRLLRSAGVRVPLHRAVAVAYAAHSLSVTLPAGPAFSTRFNFQQMRRFGASPAIASWCIAFSGILSAAALAAVGATGALASHGTPDLTTLAVLAAGTPMLIIAVRRADVIERLLRRRLPRAASTIATFTEQLKAARLTPGNATAASTFALLNWLLDAACLWLRLRATGGTGIGLGPLLLAFCAGYAAGTITIVPGGLGIIDSAIILGLTTAGIDTPTAIATVVLYRIISFGVIIGAGWIVWSAIHALPRSGQAASSRFPSPIRRHPRAHARDHRNQAAPPATSASSRELITSASPCPWARTTADEP
ncbi:hypothetical protein ACTI_64400 [Actinoplanes sp. OR16]|uniref:lysylphosphatidylglycerol synthase transmembrane domain-containing protein n=1 Tax=Actinoplanes sp. OR16 TaxID=946334 RepID=UPI000F6B6E26|nr:flippase-like domain-containing protein [Actinoplanes sp. OR16]BBH69755.1 hypothetical protein ACTI_64400 [Actinoplanes sp. OR16]